MKQIEINSEKELLDNLDKPHLIINYDIKDVSILKNCQTLVLNNKNNVTDVSALSNLKILDLSRCYQVKDVSMLSNLERLFLCGCNVTDVSALGKLKVLSLYDCIGVTDVSALSNVEELDLTNCIHIKDYSKLRNSMLIVSDSLGKKIINMLKKQVGTLIISKT